VLDSSAGASLFWVLASATWQLTNGHALVGPFSKASCGLRRKPPC